MRVRVAAIARDGVDRLDLLGAELEEQLHGPRHDLVLAHARAQHAVDLLVDGVDDRRRVLEQRDLVGRLDRAGPHHHGLRVGRLDALALQRVERLHVGQVDPQRLAGEPAIGELAVDARGERVRHPGLARHRAAHRGDAGLPARFRAATARRAGGASPPSRSPRAPGRPRAGAARSARSCRAPTRRCACSRRSGCCSGRRGAPRRASESRSDARAFSSRSLRSLAKSIRCSQSTAIVAPREAMFIVALLPRRPSDRADRHGSHRMRLFICWTNTNVRRVSSRLLTFA